MSAPPVEELFKQLTANSNVSHSHWNHVTNPQWQDLVAYFASTVGLDQKSFGSNLFRRGIALLRQTGLAEELTTQTLSHLRSLYTEFATSDDTEFATLAISFLAAAATPDAWQLLVELLEIHAPSDPRDVVVALGPLFSMATDAQVNILFPRLGFHLANLSLAAAVLDLANYYTRKKRVAIHPLANQSSALASMLGNMTQRVMKLEESAPQTQEELVTRGQQVHDAITIMIGLIDALALVGDKTHVGKLFPILEIAHRRLRVEAAAALARLDEKIGAETLCKLAAESSVRLRVLGYAEELGIDQQIDEQYRLPASRAEAELVAWLAEPTQFAVPPDSVSLFDERTLYWPGYDEPVGCFLFRYHYSRDTEFENIGIAGPVCSTVSSDLLDLPPQQIYSLFAGRDSEHEDIQQLTPDSPVATSDMQRLLGRIDPDEYMSVTPIWLGVLFEFRAAVAHAIRESQSGTLIVDDESMSWYPSGNPTRPIGAEEAYAIYKGRRLLESFNEDFGS
jgi:hypothetical protein